jgi:hypothetical protein
MDRLGTRNSGSEGEGRLVNQFSQPSPPVSLFPPPPHATLCQGKGGPRFQLP